MLIQWLYRTILAKKIRKSNHTSMLIKRRRVHQNTRATLRMLALLEKVGIISFVLFYTLPQTSLIEHTLAYGDKDSCYKQNLAGCPTNDMCIAVSEKLTHYVEQLLKNLSNVQLNAFNKSLHIAYWLANTHKEGGYKNA